MSAALTRPNADEYAAYYEKYISLVPTDDLIGFMRAQTDEIEALFSGVTEEKSLHAYAPGKWTLREVLGHLTDTERVFQYRAMSIARLDPTPLPGFDQDVWMPNAGFKERTMKSIVDEWGLVRRANIAFLESLPEGAGLRRGRASDNPVSVRALAYMSPGHTTYHAKIVRERYLS